MLGRPSLNIGSIKAASFETGRVGWGRNRVRILLAVGICCLLGGSCEVLSAEDIPYDKYICHRTEGRITVDGKLDEGAWENIIPTPVFGDIVTGKAPRYSVKAKIMWDENYLYLGYEIEDPDIWAECTERDVIMFYPKGKYNEGFVKIFIDPDGDGRNYVEIHVNPLNNVFDTWFEASYAKIIRSKLGITKSCNPHRDWNCPGLKTAVAINGTLNAPSDLDKGWTVEMAIPFSSLKQFAGKIACPPQEGDTWRVHLARRYRTSRQARKTSYWTWPYVGEVQCHRPDTWGYITFEGKRGTLAEKLNELPKANFKWRAIWAHPATTKEAVKEMVELTRKMGFNVLLFQTTGFNGRCWYNSQILKKPKNVEIDPLREVIKEAKKSGIKVYAWTVNLCSLPDTFFETHPGYLQKVRPKEKRMAGRPRTNPDRENLCGGNLWLCPDRGLLEEEKRIIQEIVKNYDIDGVAIDYLGYRNYYACFCDYSNKKRAEFAEGLAKKGAHCFLGRTEEMIRKEFSEQSLVNWTRELRKVVKAIRPGVKISIHVYPDFDPNPLYGNRLWVDYCGQTIAWFYKPFWRYEKIYHKAMWYKSVEGKYHDYNRFVPFIGVSTGKLSKSPERLRKEIRIAGVSGAKTIMIAFYRTLLENPNLAEVVAEELK